VLRLELDLLDRSSKRFFADAEDRAMADVSDFQGVGGTPSPSKTPEGNPPSKLAERTRT